MPRKATFEGPTAGVLGEVRPAKYYSSMTGDFSPIFLLEVLVFLGRTTLVYSTDNGMKTETTAEQKLLSTRGGVLSADRFLRWNQLSLSNKSDNRASTPANIHKT